MERRTYWFIAVVAVVVIVAAVWFKYLRAMDDSMPAMGSNSSLSVALPPKTATND